MKTTLLVRIVLASLAVVVLAACGSGLSGKYGGNDCAFELTFRGNDSVYVQVMGLTEIAAQYRIDGDKVVVSAPNWPGAVFTRKDNTLEAAFMGQKMVCKKID